MTDRRHRIALIPGDGVGPKVVAQAVRVLEVVARNEFRLDVVEFDIGASRFLRGEEVLAQSELDDLASFDAIFLGALGDPRVPPGILERELLRIRQDLDMYANLRPARLWPGVASPLGALAPEDVNMLIVRENTEGLYAWRDDALEEGTEISPNTAGAVERIIRYAFETASQLNRPLTLIHKVNVLRRAGGLYARTFEELAREFPSVETSYLHVDAAAYLMVTDPRRFGVIVTDNLFGDILSDLAAALAGGIGLVPSGNIHPGRVSMFEPIHGSAPDIAGQNKANPTGAVLSVGMMLDHLGEPAAATRIRDAVETTASKIVVDALTTTDAGDLILEALA